MTYRFVNSFDTAKSTQTPDISFLQIAIYAHPKTKLYHIRKFTINSQNTITAVKEYNIPKNQYDKLLEKKKNNQYKLYSVYSLSDIDYPSGGDIELLKSNILSSNSSYTGFAQF